MLGKNAAAVSDKIRVAPFMQKYFKKLTKDDASVPQALFAQKAEVLPNGLKAVTCATSDGAVWLGSANGLTRVASDKEYYRDRIQYFAAPRYLWDNNVLSLYADGNGVWVETETGVTHIWYSEMTYLEKAAEYRKYAAEN